MYKGLGGINHKRLAWPERGRHRRNSHYFTSKVSLHGRVIWLNFTFTLLPTIAYGTPYPWTRRPRLESARRQHFILKRDHSTTHAFTAVV